MDDNFPEKVDNYFKILEENIDILANLAIDLEDEKEDELVPYLELYQLFDMTEDVSESSKIKRAEFNLARRDAEKSL